MLYSSMEQCPKCNSENIRHVPRKISGKDMLIGGPATEIIRLNSKWGTCDNCGFHYPLEKPHKGYFPRKMKNPRLVNGSFSIILGVVFLLIGILAITSADAVVWRWVLVGVGAALIVLGIFSVIRGIRKRY